MKKAKDDRMTATIRVKRADGKWEEVFKAKVKTFDEFFELLETKNKERKENNHGKEEEVSGDDSHRANE